MTEKTIHGMPASEYVKLDAAHQKLAKKLLDMGAWKKMIHGHGINKDDKGWYIMVATVDKTYEAIPSEMDGYRVIQEVRPPARLA